MRDLIDLVNIVTRTKLRSVELIGDNSDGSSKMQEFYDLIADGSFSEDDEAAAHFYGADKSTPSFQKLRKNLKDRLVNSLFIIDLKQASYTDRQKAYYECYKEWAAAKILFGKNARTAAVGIARKLLKIAKKYEFTELIVDICHTLRLFHGTIEGDYKKYQQYNEDFKAHEQMWIQENRAEEYFIELSIGFINSKATKTEFQEKARAYHKAVQPAMEQYNSYHLHLCGRLIEVSIFTAVNDYRNTLQVCDQAIAFFEKKGFVASVPLQVFHYQKFICHIQLREFDQARLAAEDCLKYLEEGKFNWFKLYELYFLLYTHNEQYLKAREILNKIIAHPNFPELPGNVQETWKISEAYLYFLETAGKLSPPSNEAEHASSFRLSKFLNEMEVFSKDKQGMNIPILIIELLLGIATQKYDELIDRVEAMDKYRTRYLRDEEIIRSNYFLKMLLQIPKNAFRRADAMSKAEEDYMALAAIPIEMANQTFEIEIIPYEKLWEYILEILPE
ncbi:MAG: hypothetical protein KDD02_06520 [Phaeodactylibacter sp.]|nr:hypothetical protein [Phaeodactylibacter sp.]MCB9299091.1 hypothetical protein [Lewinellaceae bacterium]HQU58490.1 hypothetical protein [Saprospiraceae bacterium]